jgi:hypothetical protein
MSECLAHRRPLVFVRRDYFNEEPFLRKVGCRVRVLAVAPFFGGASQLALLRALAFMRKVGCGVLFLAAA